MAKAGRGLGRGMDVLLPTDINLKRLIGDAEIINLTVDDIIPNPEQPRRTISELRLSELAQSIREHGILQPLLVVRKEAGYMIIAGERRWRAAKEAGLKQVPCIVRTFNNIEQLQVALIENVQREDLNAIEQAESIRRLREDFGRSYTDIAKSLGKATVTIMNMVRLLKLPEEMRQSLIEGKITEGHGRAILALADYPAQQQVLHNSVIQSGWSVRRAEQFVKDVKEKRLDDPQLRKRNSNYVTNQWTKLLGKKLKAEVLINPMAKGGFIKINYRSDEQLKKLQDFFEAL